MGLLYSAQEFISFVNANALIGDDFTRIEHRFALATPIDIYSLSSRCNWIQLDSKGYCILTARGKEIVGLVSPELMLRNQLQDIIEIYQPSWAIKIRNGRAEVIDFFPDEIGQIFKEAGLFEPWSDELIFWWDILALQVRAQKNNDLLQIGRAAEKLSILYETERTGLMPRWQSIESNYSGFDILSVAGPRDGRKIQIEVKGTELNMKEANFTVTRNEWKTAMSAEIYRFHLWALKGEKKRIIELDAVEVKPHIPEDSGDGKWESVRIPFKVFSGKAREIDRQLSI